MSRARRWIAVGLTSCAPLAAAGALAPGASALEPVAPTTAARFHDSVGVVTHDNYADTPYVQADRVVAALKELGVSHVRDGLFVTGDPAVNARLQGDLTAYANAGLRLTLILNRDCAASGGLPACLAVLRDRLPAGSVEAVEWPHEDDRFGGAWAAPLAAWGRQLYGLMKADPRLRAIPVIGPSLARYDSPALLGDQSQFLDFGTIHPFTGAASPQPADIAAQLQRYAVVGGTKPVLATAAGFGTSPVAAPADQPPADEQTAAVYTLRTFLEHYADGISRTFLYELLDEHADLRRADANFGLLRSDFSPKPAYTALRNLLALAGTGAPRSVVRLPYSLTTDAADLRQVVVQRSDGSYLLVLWRTASVWDRDAKRQLAVTPRSVTVTAPDARSFATGDPISGAALTAQTPSSPGRLTLGVGADPRIVRLTTAAGAAQATTAALTDGVPAGSGDRGGVAGVRAARRARLSGLRVKRVGRTYRATFTLGGRYRVRGRIDKPSGRPRHYRTAKRLRQRTLASGRRTMVLGALRTGRQRLKLDVRAKGHTRRYTVYFTVRAVHRRR